MKLIFTSYSSAPDYEDPALWLKRIKAYAGVLEHLAKEHEVVGIERIQYEGSVRQNDVLYYFIRLKKKVVHFPLELHRLIRRLRPDVVFVNGFIFPHQIIQLRIKLGRQVKIIVLHRAERPFRGVKRLLQLAADRCVDAYLFSSSEFGITWKKNINTRKIHEIVQASSLFKPMGRTAARAITGVNGGPAYLWVGALISRKDPVTVVKAFLQYLHWQPEAKLYMIYQSEELLREIKTLIDSRQLAAESILLIGPIAHAQLLYWYNSVDFFITGSKYEGSGVALMEAMSCGCIPITTDFISFQKMTGDGKCGLSFEAGNEQSLLSAFLHTSELDIDQEKALVLKQFENELSFEAIARKINQVIAHV